MRRTAVALVLLVAAFGLVAAGCGQEQEQSATPETVEGSTPTETTETETTETETTETTGTETTETDETENTETTETETTATTPAVEGDPVAGKEVFLGASACGGCHTLADAGSSGTVGPNLDEAMPDNELVVDRVTNGQGGMPSFSSTLTEQQIADVAAYVSSVAGS
ncbi:MAG TPA: c-type cytochrome [Gaiellaceae bacterium]|nr:c-type cytochrome [Gaiellaceae bacterium]